MTLLIPCTFFAAEVEFTKWNSGESFLNFLEKHKLPQKLYYNLDKDEQTITEEIYAGVNVQILRDANNTVEQVLIPVSSELQLHLYKEDAAYKFESIPIIYSKKQEAFSVSIENSPYYDIIKSTGSKKLAHQFVNASINSLNIRRHPQKSAGPVTAYVQKYR